MRLQHEQPHLRSLRLRRLQASVGGLLAGLIPRSRIVPAVRPEDMSTDAETVSSPLLLLYAMVAI